MNLERLSQLGKLEIITCNQWPTRTTPKSIQCFSIDGEYDSELRQLTQLTALKISPDDNWDPPECLLELHVLQKQDLYPYLLAGLTRLTMLHIKGLPQDDLVWPAEVPLRCTPCQHGHREAAYWERCHTLSSRHLCGCLAAANV